MAIPQSELHKCLRATGAFVEKRRPKPEIRDRVDLRADIEGSALVLSEVRPAYNDPRVIRHSPIAKAKWIGTQKRWRLYWMRADLKWHAYDAGDGSTVSLKSSQRLIAIRMAAFSDSSQAANHPRATPGTLVLTRPGAGPWERVVHLYLRRNAL